MLRGSMPALGLASAFCAACANTAPAIVDIGPTGPVSLAFVDPAPGAPACRAIGSDVTARVPLLLDVENFVLRPPGACGSISQCGFLQLVADGVLNGQAAQKAIDLDAGKLANPYHDGAIDPATGKPDVLSVTVTGLVEDSSGYFVDANGVASDTYPLTNPVVIPNPDVQPQPQPVVATTQLIIKPSCP